MVTLTLCCLNGTEPASSRMLWAQLFRSYTLIEPFEDDIYILKFAISADLSTKEHNSYVQLRYLVRSSFILTSLVSGLFLNFFKFFTRWYLLSTYFNLAIICLGWVPFLLSLPTRCELVITPRWRRMQAANSINYIIYCILSRCFGYTWHTNQGSMTILFKFINFKKKIFVLFLKKLTFL